MGALETIAGIFAALTIVKLVAIFFKPSLMKNSFDFWMKKKGLMMGLILVFTVVIGYFVLANMTVVQVLAAFFLGHMLMGLFFLSYPKSIEKFYKDVMKDGMKSALLPILVYLALSIWALYTILA